MKKGFVFCLVLIVSLIFFSSQKNACAENVKPRILVLYHTEEIKPSDKNVLQLPDEVIMLVNILGHFEASVARFSIDQYVPGVIKLYDVVLYLGKKQGSKIPQSFLNDISKYEDTTVVWLRWNIDQFLANHQEEYGFKIKPMSGGFYNLIYNKQIYSREDQEQVNIVEVENREIVRTNALLLSEAGYAAFSVHSKNLWYFPDAIFYGISNTVFCDMLHEVFEIPHEIDPRFFVRIEDIHPMRSASKLRNHCKELNKKEVPFILSVIPQYVKPGTSAPIFLKDKPHLVRALKDCAGTGGSIVMHGYTHQWKNESGEGYEFWDVPNDRPIDEYTEQTIHEKMQKGIKALTDLGLYPIAWETPHYAADERTYSIISQYFSTVVEQRQVSNRTYTMSQTTPYIVRDIYGCTVVPENLGFLSFDLGETPERKIENAIPFKKAVRDPVVGFFFHPYYDTKYMMQIVEGLMQLGFAPLDLRDIPSLVMGETTNIFSGLSRYQIFRPTVKMATLNGDARMLKIKMKDDWLNTFMVDNHYSKFQEKWRKVEQGPALVQVPDRQEGIYVVRTAEEKPGWFQRFKAMIFSMVLGKTSNRVETIQRWVVWVFFLLTLVFVVVIFRILMTRTSFHDSHFRSEKDKQADKDKKRK